MRQKKERKAAIRDRKQQLFQTAFLLYTTATYLQMTMYTQYRVLAGIFLYMRYAAFGLLLLLIALNIRSDFGKNRGQKGNGWMVSHKYSFLCLFAMAVTGAAAVRTGDRTVLFVAAFLFAAKKRYLNGILSIAFAAQGCLFVLVIAGCMAGVIPDLLIKRDAIPIRHSLGFTYPSVCTGYLFFLLLLFLWIYGDRIGKRELLWMEIVNCLIYLLTDTRIFFILATLLLGAAYFFCCRDADRICTGLLRKQQREKKRIYRICTVLYDYYVVILFFIYALMCVLDQASGGNSILDRILSGRLGLTTAAVKNYGIHLIADKITWIGFGGTENTDVLLETYNFVDCSYAYILLSYGILVFLIVMIYLIFMQKYIRKREGVWRSLLLVFIWSYCLLEPRLLEIQANCFLLLGAPVLGAVKKRKEMEYHG